MCGIVYIQSETCGKCKDAIHAAANGHMECLKRMYDLLDRDDRQTACANAVANGNIECIDYIMNEEPSMFNGEIYDMASEDVLQHMLNKKFICDMRLLKFDWYKQEVGDKY